MAERDLADGSTPREVVRRAIELQVLEPEDVQEAGGHHQPPARLVESLEKRGSLSVAAVAALERLVELRPNPALAPPAPRTGGPGTLAGEGGLNVGSATLSGAGTSIGRSAAPGTLAPGAPGTIPLALDLAAASKSMTVAPAREASGSSGVLELGAARSGTLAPAREGASAAGVLDLTGRGAGTVAPAREQSNRDEPAGLRLGAAAGTVAPARELEHSSAPTAIDLGAKSGTVAHARLAIDDGGLGLALGQGTVAPARELVAAAASGPALDLTAGTIAPASELAAEGSPAEDLVDLSILEPGHRRILEEAAFCRISLRLGLATREQIDAAMARGEQRVEEALVESGALAQDKAFEILGLRSSSRSACANCYGVLPSDHVPGTACPLCGDTTGTSTGTAAGKGSASKGGQTLVPRGPRGGIEGFPGEGGTFAGYELLERVAEGGMGVVFRARQISLNRIVALKVMRGGSLASKARRRRFLQEAEAAAALKHPSIVAVHEIDETVGYPFYTMDFVEGLSLDEHVRQKKCSPEEIAALGRSIADAVQHFHLHGIIHRDLKPDNILVGKDGVPKIIDFGIAKKLGNETDSGTIEGDVLGTPHYMSPEQAAGRVREVDTRTDVYALGTILYELLTGAAPFKGLPNARLVVAIQEDEPDPIRTKNSRVEGDLEAIVGKAMAKERERRYQSAGELAQDLERFEKRLPVQARPATIMYRVRKAVRRRLPAVIAGSVCLLVVAIAGSFAAYRAAEDRREAAARHSEIEKLLADARQSDLSIDARTEKLNQVLGMDRENREATSQLELLRQEKAAAAKLERDKQEAERSKVEAELAKERAERQAKAQEAALKAREQAEKDALHRQEATARAHRDKAVASADPKAAWSELNDALALLPVDRAELATLRTEVETKKVALDVDLARADLAANKADMAEFWLRDAQKLASSKARAQDLEKISAEVAELASGRRELDEAKVLLAAGNLLAARQKLEQARKLGVAASVVEKELAVVEDGCQRHAAAVVGQGQAALGRGDALAGLASAREALVFEPGSASAKALATDCEGRVSGDARRDAARLWRTPESRSQAVARLREGEAALQGPQLQSQALLDALARERVARTKLLEDQRLAAAVVFVPEVDELGVKPLFAMRTEVTNAAFKQFVDSGGYRDATLWDEAGKSRLATFRDHCPGGNCNHRAPRTWVEGGYGDPANAERPVRGVTVHEARAFARWYSQVTGVAWRLPTRAEWEAAAGWDPVQRRLQRYPWGDEFSPAIPHDTDLPEPVGTTAADVSPLGLADAGGNVFEWIEAPGSSPGTTVPATKKADCQCDELVARSFSDVHHTNFPSDDPPDELVSRVGFRLVREAK